VPSYEFRCESCGLDFEEFKKTIGAPEAPPCPGCSGKTELLIGGDQVIGRVNGDPTTLGQQAELNSRKMGKELTSLKAAEAKKPRIKKPSGLKLPKGARRVDTSNAKTPFWREGKEPLKLDKLLNNGKPDARKVKKYIHEGKL